MERVAVPSERTRHSENCSKGFIKRFAVCDQCAGAGRFSVIGVVDKVMFKYRRYGASERYRLVKAASETPRPHATHEQGLR